MKTRKSLSVDAALSRAKSLLKRGDAEGARTLYNDVLERFPGNRRVQEALASLGAGAGGTRVASPGLTREEFDRVVALLQRGDAKAARESAAALLSRYPAFPPLLNLAGGIEATLGNHEQAAGHYRRALAADAGFGDAHNNLAAALLELGDVAGALRHAAEAVRIAPANPAARVNLGNARLRAQDYADATAAYEEALRLQPAHPDAHSNLASALIFLNRPGDAVVHAREAIRLRPGFVEANLHLGEALTAVGEYGEAEAAFRAALAARPEYRRALAGLAVAMRRAGRYDEAIATFEETLRLRPDAILARLHLGEIKRDLGREAEAEELFREVLDREPGNALAFFNLSFMKKLKADDPLLAAMESTLAGGEETYDDEERVTIGFALAKVYEDGGRDDEAFEQYAAANRLKRATLRYDVESFRHVADRIRETFAAAPDPAPAALSGEKPRPVFIVGMPRSGTTLVEQILASHSAVFGGDELQLLGPICEPDFVRGPVPASRYADPHWLETVRGRYLEGLRKVDADHAVVTDKMPFNYLWIGAILAAMPEARIIHLRRDPVAVCWSNYRTRFAGDNIWFSWDLADLADYYRIYHQTMAFMRQRYPGRFLDLDYEALTENPEEEARRLVAYCGLDWEPACLDFHKTERAVKTASVHQVRQGIYKGSSKSWKRFEKHLAPLIERLGDLVDSD
ncbi:MAG: sulfotransferase [Flavobacteriaceae bacterium]